MAAGRVRSLLSMLTFYGGMILTLGSITFFGVGVAGAVFQALPAKDFAGEVNALLLQRLTVVQIVGEVLVLLGIFFWIGTGRRWFAKIPLWLALIMLVITVIYGVLLLGIMNELRLTISSFDNPTFEDQPLIEQFNLYHSWYMILATANWAIGVLLFLWQTIEYSVRKTSVPSPPVSHEHSEKEIPPSRTVSSGQSDQENIQ